MKLLKQNLLKKKFFSFPAAGAAGLVILGLWGCLLIYSSKAFGGSPMHFVDRQLVWLVMGAAGFIAASMVPFEIYQRVRVPFFILSVIMLLCVLLFGVEIGGMKGWFRLPVQNVYFQPSELAKMAFILYLCGIKNEGEKQSEFARFAHMALASCIMCALLLLEPDLGTCVLFFGVFLTIYWVSGGWIRYILLSAGLFLVAFFTFILANPYAMDRIRGFLDPGSSIWRSSWHIRQFQYTMAHGGVAGSETGGAMWANAYLPLPHSDSLFATIVESSGLIGGMIVIAGFACLLLAFGAMALRRHLSDCAKLFIFSTGCLYSVQALLHISVNTALIPPTGLTLPILSYGGSSLLTTMLAFGMVFSASRSSDDEGDLQEEETESFSGEHR